MGRTAAPPRTRLYTLIDYLDPEATRTFIKLIYETYEKAVGDEFGKTVLGFRGDETDYTGVSPWTPKLLETFQKVKGLRLQTLHPPDLRRPDDARGATRQGRLLGRVERHVPRQFLQAAARLVQRAATWNTWST